MRIFQVYLTTPQINKLKKLSIKTETSIAELIRRAVDKFLEKKK